MKPIYLLTSLCLLWFCMGCAKEQLPQTEASTIKTTIPPDADVVFHYQGIAYPLYFQEDSETDFVEDEGYLALQEIVENGASEFFKLADYPDHHTFIFDSEWQDYDYIEQYSDAYLGRRYKLAFRIEQLREQLIATYGQPLDYSNSALIAEAETGIASMYEELKISSPMPRSIAAFIGMEGGNFIPSNNGRNNPVLTVHEHDDLQGQYIDIETASHTNVWTYGDWDCYTMAANSDLSLEFKLDGTNWNDCISSQYFRYIQGASAMIIARHRDINFATSNCGYMRYEYRANYFVNTCCEFSNMRDTPWRFPCGHQNDQISSIKIKAIWNGCPITYQDI